MIRESGAGTGAALSSRPEGGAWTAAEGPINGAGTTGSRWSCYSVTRTQVFVSPAIRP